VVFGPDERTIPSVRRDLFAKDEQVMRSVVFSYAQTASQDFARIFDGKNIFDNPKSYRDLRRLVEYLTHPGDLVLDFFAGSGTTAHGVLLANDDGGSRRFVLIQLPERLDEKTKTGKAAAELCQELGVPPTVSEITKERVRRVIKKLNEDDAGKIDLDGDRKQDRGFRVFKLAESNFKTWEADRPKDAEALAKQLELHVEHIRDGRTAEDLLYEVLLKSGFPLTTPIDSLTLAGKPVHSVADGALLVCVERELTLDVIRAMAERKPERVVCLDAGFAGNDQLKANAAQIFRSSGVTSFRTV
jgi:adenine-specific DNA-methyltransferase